MEMAADDDLKQPVFGVAMRILQFRREALSRRTLWPLKDAADDLEVSTKTLKRYVTFLKLLDTDDEGMPLIQIVHVKGRPHISSKAKRRRGDN